MAEAISKMKRLGMTSGERDSGAELPEGAAKYGMVLKRGEGDTTLLDEAIAFVMTGRLFSGWPSGWRMWRRN